MGWWGGGGVPDRVGEGDEVLHGGGKGGGVQGPFPPSSLISVVVCWSGLSRLYYLHLISHSKYSAWDC